MRVAPFGFALSEQAAEEIDVLEHAQRRIEIAPEALRHVGDAAAHGAQAPDVGEIAAEHEDAALLDPAHARDEAEQRGFADAVGADHANHLAGGNVDADVVERICRAIFVRDARDLRDDLGCHCAGSLTCRSSGQAT